MPTARPSRPGRPSTRDRLLSASADLFQRRGYSASGLSEITARASAPKGSLYFHFPGGKEQLAAEALERAGAEQAEAIDAVLLGAPDAASAIRALTAHFAARLQSSDYQLGCPIATTALEQAATSARLREVSQGAYTRWLELLRIRLQADGREPATAAEQALFVLSAIEGALVLARASRSTRPLRVVAQQLAASLGDEPALPL